MSRYKTYRNVSLGDGSVIEDYCILGEPPRGKKPGELSLTIGKNALIRSHAVIYAGNRIGDNFQTGHGVKIRENNVIGNNVSIGTLASLEHSNIIGNNVRIHTKVTIGEFVRIDDNVFIGPQVIFLNDPHPSCPRYKECIGGPIIKKNVKIGANVTIMPGVVIGENAVIGAASVVTKDVPPNIVALGNPAKIIRKVNELKCFKGFFERPYEWKKL